MNRFVLCFVVCLIGCGKTETPSSYPSESYPSTGLPSGSHGISAAMFQEAIKSATTEESKRVLFYLGLAELFSDRPASVRGLLESDMFDPTFNVHGQEQEQFAKRALHVFKIVRPHVQDDQARKEMLEFLAKNFRTDHDEIIRYLDKSME